MDISHEMQGRLARLKKLLSWYVAFPDSNWSAAERLFCFRCFAPGEHIIEAGELVTELGFLLAGLARYYYLTPEGKEFNKSFVQAGQVVSSVSSLVAGKPAPFYIQALESCECLFLGYEKLCALCETDRNWERLARCLLEQLVIKKEGREADFLLLSAPERYEKFLVEYADVAARIPNYHIASYLGITEVALSRIRKRLGLVRLNQG